MFRNSRSQIVFRTDNFPKIVVGCPCLGFIIPRGLWPPNRSMSDLCVGSNLVPRAQEKASWERGCLGSRFLSPRCLCPRRLSASNWRHYSFLFPHYLCRDKLDFLCLLVVNFDVLLYSNNFHDWPILEEKKMARRKVKNPDATDLPLIIWEPVNGKFC